MLAVDSCSLIAYEQGQTGEDIETLDSHLMTGSVRLPPVVMTELLSWPVQSERSLFMLPSMKLLSVKKDYWMRAGQLRALVLQSGFKAKLGDALIAQSCIDHDIPLITRDTDFRHYVETGGLKLAC